jgi:hypothetical protein
VPLLASGPCPNPGELPADTTAWYVVPTGWTIS